MPIRTPGVNDRCGATPEARRKDVLTIVIWCYWRRWLAQGSLALQKRTVSSSVWKISASRSWNSSTSCSEMTSDIKLGSLLQKVMAKRRACSMRSVQPLFLHDEKTKELWSEVGQGLESSQIRLPQSCRHRRCGFHVRQDINSLRLWPTCAFNPAFDKKTGFFTRSILCVPVMK